MYYYVMKPMISDVIWLPNSIWWNEIKFDEPVVILYWDHVLLLAVIKHPWRNQQKYVDEHGIVVTVGSPVALFVRPGQHASALWWIVTVKAWWL